ncbi:TPR repeat [Teratosphaeria destructans]|uniref:TPR repeat n=1 Tax=Teratosphaeria destructans TaxID=418781 RepID=A0A9W7VXJ0_9PEZI|nr:TPR repeat [Teratosphaeria destructans]
MPDIAHFSDSDNESFHSFDDNEPSPPRSTVPTAEHKCTTRTRSSSPQPDIPDKAELERFSPEEESSLLAEANTLKGSANQAFGSGNFENAIQTYDRALAICPSYLDYEIAVLRSNIAACCLKLEEWKDAVASAEKGIECLENLEPLPQPEKKQAASKADEAAQKAVEQDDQEANLVQEVDEKVAERIENLQKSGHTLDEVRKLQVKLLMRRAKARTEVGGWASLQGADEDYRVLLSPTMLPSLSPTDRRQVSEAARKLGPKLNEAKDREMAEMMDKLKGLGNSILKPFGLSTSNFQFQQDPKTGGYSMNFNQNPGKS